MDAFPSFTSSVHFQNPKPNIFNHVCGQGSTKEVEKNAMFDHDDVMDSKQGRGDPYVDQNP